MKRIFLYTLAVCLIFISTPHVIAQSSSEVDGRIKELLQKIGDLQQEENTLSKQINLLNSQISLATLRIDTIRNAIVKLSSEIDELEDEIDKLEILLTRRTELVLRRIPESYKRQVTPQFGLLFFSKNFSDFIAKAKYLTTVQADDARLLFQLKATQSNFSERKTVREQKKTEQEKLKKQLENEQKQLDRQKKEKQSLLEQTKNSESVYQTLLAQALAEKQAVERALIEGVEIGPVNAGDPIALVGNTGYPGCSTGAHLHFEVRRNNNWTDPAEFLSSKSVIDEQNGGSSSIGRGSWSWPIQEPIRLTQYFGKTPYSWRYAYSGGIHTGFDMVSTSSTVIKAPKDGKLFSSSQNCGSGSIIKIKYIEHGDGIVSFYLHVQ